MRTEKLQLSDVRYNPEHGAFEAVVRIYDGKESFDYPAHICASLQAEFSLISRSLVAKANRAHRSASPEMLLRKRAVPVQMVNRPAPQTRETPLMLRMLRALAA